MNIDVYTDGSATTKDKPGGWAYVIVIDGKEHFFGSGSMPNATNNDAELEAAIQGLSSLLKFFQTHGEPVEGATRTLDDPFKIIYPPAYTATLCSDSEIILKWANGTNRFKQADKIVKYNQLRWLMKRLHAHTRWVEGHAGHEFNEKCDKMAREERNKAMGIIKKPRSSKSVQLKQACEKMREALEYIQSEMFILSGRGLFTRHDIEDKCAEALDFYKEKMNG